MKRYVFNWVENRTLCECEAKFEAESDDEAIAKALLFGYTPFKWYKPSTWSNCWGSYKIYRT